MKSHLHLGLGAHDFLQYATAPFLLIDGGEIAEEFATAFPAARIFEPSRHSFDPLHNIDHKKARDITSALFSYQEHGKTTLTKGEGARALAPLLLELSSLERVPEPKKDDRGMIEAIATVNDLLFSPVLRKVFCTKPDFFPHKKRSIIARINRAELGDFDAFFLATFLTLQFQGQVIVPDFGFYGRDFYTALIQQNRLVAGLRYLGEVPTPLQRVLLTIPVEQWHLDQLTREDAEKLISYTNPTGNPNTLMG